MITRNNNTEDHTVSYYADKMLYRIVNCIKDEIKKNSAKVETAIVTQVNQDGTVNVTLPSDENSKFTGILNQTPFVLNVGDSVEILLKNGSYSNCWIIAKHGASLLTSKDGNSSSVSETQILQNTVQQLSDTVQTLTENLQLLSDKLEEKVPDTTIADNGKFLRVVNGSSSWSALDAAEDQVF